MVTVKDMLSVIEIEARSAAAWTGRHSISDKVLVAMAKVPRHEFVPVELRHSAYDNCPLPIGYGQTISQPYIVALMTDLLGLQGNEVVLEVGTGSGYQAAVLSQLVKKVYGMENVAPLVVAAQKRLQRLGYDNIEVVWGNGYQGMPSKAPFDAILVAATAPGAPRALLDQLRPGGKMVIPVAGQGYGQELKLLQKTAQGDIETRTVLPVAFVPLVDQTFSNASPPA